MVEKRVRLGPESSVSFYRFRYPSPEVMLQPYSTSSKGEIHADKLKKSSQSHTYASVSSKAARRRLLGKAYALFGLRTEAPTAAEWRRPRTLDCGSSERKGVSVSFAAFPGGQ